MLRNPCACCRSQPMPEGPEIRRAADCIEAVLAGEIVEAVRFGLPRLRRHAPTPRMGEVPRPKVRPRPCRVA